jgi:hypothetical protein
VTQLRKQMLVELERRNYSQTTVKGYFADPRLPTRSVRRAGGFVQTPFPARLCMAGVPVPMRPANVRRWQSTMESEDSPDATPVRRCH